MTAPKPDLLDAIKALADDIQRANRKHSSLQPVNEAANTFPYGVDAGLNLAARLVRGLLDHPALLAGATTSETVEGGRRLPERQSPVPDARRSGGMVESHPRCSCGCFTADPACKVHPTPAPVPTEGGEQP